MIRFSRLCQLQFSIGFIFAIAAISLVAQTAVIAGTVSGTVSDPSGAVIANARIELIERGVPVAFVTTNAMGQYNIQRNPVPGSRLRVSVPGFSTADRAIDTTGNSRGVTLDIVLQIAPLSEQITVTSTGAPTPQAQLGAAVTVVDSSDYQGTRDIQEGLRFVPGLQATQTGQAGGTTSVFIRGGSSDANKVLIDGIPMNDIGGSVEFANIASAAVAQAEVLRGPNSALYGSDALAGVISLTTARGSTPLPLFSYSVDGGNLYTYLQEGTVGGRYRKFDYFSDYSRFVSSNAIADNEYHNGTFTGNYGWEISPASSLRATIHHDQVASGQPGAMQFYGIPTDAEQANEDAYFGVTWDDKTTPNWNNLIRYGGVRLRSNYTQFAAAGTAASSYTLGAPITIYGANGYSVSGQAQEPNDCAPNSDYLSPCPYTYPTSTDKDFVYAQSDYRFNPHILGLVAFRYEDERGYAVSPDPSNSRERGNYSYTFEMQGDIKNRLFYVLGGGLEDNGLFGIAGTPRASLAWQVAGGTKLRASFGKGIKEPALDDQIYSLYDELETQSGGSQIISQDHIASIGPENSRTYDGGIDQFFFKGRSRVSLSLFHNEFTHGIEYVSWQEIPIIDPNINSATAQAEWPGGAYVNSKAYRAQGIEAEIESKLRRDWFVRAGYTYVDARIQQSFSSSAIGPSYNPDFSTIPIGAYSPLVGARPFRIAPHTGYFQSGYRHAKLFAMLSGTLVSRRDDSDFLEDYDANGGNTLLLPNRNLDGSYQRLDLAASYQASRHVSIETNLQNLLNEHYSEAFGYPDLPFTFRSGIKLNFGGESWKLK
jgi:iron complex outermembrane receptor protein/vitamin B12 transporter